MILLLCVCMATASAVNSALDKPHYDIEQAEQLFEALVLTHEKSYSSKEEKQMRFELFKENVKRINARNSVSDAIFAINHFSDLTQEEMDQYMGFVPSSESYKCDILTDKDISTIDAPKSLDWRSKGAVTAVKNQGACAVCWAFATVANIEGQHFLKAKQLQSLSEQELVDCSKSNTGGCIFGGDMETALVDLKQLGGVELESSYPYVTRKQTCQFDISKSVARVVGCKRYKLKDEEKLKQVLVQKGPLVIGLNGAQLFEYHKGIITKQDCESQVFKGHAVLLVGYGTGENGIDYWLIKNSWGSKFGEEGYFRISRGENTCRMIEYICSADL